MMMMIMEENEEEEDEEEVELWYLAQDLVEQGLLVLQAVSFIHH